MWHEECFMCFECKQPIRTQSFLAKGDDIYCAPCHDKKFAKKCFHCKQVGPVVVSPAVCAGSRLQREIQRGRVTVHVLQDMNDIPAL